MTAATPNQNLQIRRLDARSGSFSAELEALRRQLSPDGDIVSPRGKELTERVFGQALKPSEVVERICSEVRREGISAVVRYTQLLDGVEHDPTRLRLDEQRLAAAHAAASPEFLGAIRRVRANVHRFQTAILHASVDYRPEPGVVLQQRYVPLRRVGVCVPGGAAAYPSSVLMTVVPAQAAGVDEIAVVAPPTPFGAYNADFLATCHELGIREIYPIGGAQAVAALAFGGQGLPPVDKIVGPGNLFVALAKKWVYGHVDIDSIAGPSEVVVIADETTSPAYTAADMLAQAEHSPGASLLITWHEPLISQVEAELNNQLEQLSRRGLTTDSLNAFGAFILVRDRQQACELTDLIAPEHLHISCQESRELSATIRTAGATFLGPYSPVALGDYAAGPSHVLPTGGTARWAAGLSANSFLRGGSVIEFDRGALADLQASIDVLADCEGLSAHRQSVDIRLQ
jgi:histidinol dehydrogenase